MNTLLKRLRAQIRENSSIRLTRGMKLQLRSRRLPGWKNDQARGKLGLAELGREEDFSVPPRSAITHRGGQMDKMGQRRLVD